MANIFFNLPSTAGDGSGAPVDVSTMGALKTIVVSNTDATVTVEFSNESTPTVWALAANFRGGGDQTVSIAAHWMRVRTTGYRTGGAADVEVGGTDDGAQFAN